MTRKKNKPFDNSSEKYWRDREENAKAKYLQEEIPYKQYVKDLYGKMLDGVDNEINAFYAKYAKKEGITLAEAKKRVSSLDIKAYERKARLYVKGKNFSKRANDEMRIYNLTMKVNRLELLKANIGLELTSGSDELNNYLDKVLRKRTIDEIKRQSGILGKTISANAEKIRSIVNGSFYSTVFSDRVWGHQTLLKSELEKHLVQGLIAGKNPRELARKIRDTFGKSMYEAQRLMVTELARVQTDAQKLSYEETDTERYEFIGGQAGICPICEALDGKNFSVKDMVIGKNAPPMHPHCRCSTASYWSDDEEKRLQLALNMQKG